jgi:hypothetical protein
MDVVGEVRMLVSYEITQWYAIARRYRRQKTWLLNLPWTLSIGSTETELLSSLKRVYGPLSKYRDFGGFSMNKTGSRRKIFLTRAHAVNCCYQLLRFILKFMS